MLERVISATRWARATAPRGASAVDRGHVRVALPGGGAGGRGLVDAREVLGGELDRRRPPRSPRGSARAWCRGSGRCPRPACSSQASASWPGVASFSAAISRTRSTSSRFASKFSPWKRGLWRRKSSSARSSGDCDRARSGSRGRAGCRRRSRCPSSRTVGRTSSSGSRVHSEYSVCSAAIGCTACGAADRVRRRPRTGRGGAPCPARRAPPSRRRSPRSGRLGRRGAGSRGRCGRRRAAQRGVAAPRGRTRARR